MLPNKRSFLRKSAALSIAALLVSISSVGAQSAPPPIAPPPIAPEVTPGVVPPQAAASSQPPIVAPAPVNPPATSLSPAPGIPGDPKDKPPIRVESSISQSKEDIARLQAELGGIGVKVSDEDRRKLLAFLREGYAGTNVDIYVDAQFVVVRIPEAVFRMGSTRVPVSVRDQLKPTAAAIEKFGGLFDLLVEGHSDPTPPRKNSRSTNYEMAYTRAEGIASALSEMKVPVQNMGIVSRAHGLLADEQNRTSNNNRRVELVFSPKRTVKATASSAPNPPSTAATKPKTGSVSAGTTAPATTTASVSPVAETAAQRPSSVPTAPASTNAQAPQAVGQQAPVPVVPAVDPTASLPQNQSTPKEIAATANGASEAITGRPVQQVPANAALASAIAPGPIQTDPLPEPEEIIIDLPVIAIGR